MNFELKARNIGNKSIQTVLARDIWLEVESRQEFTNWIKSRVKQGGFIEGVDFIVLDKSINAETLGFKGKIEYYVSIDMGKHLGMMERNQKGKDVRQHFIDVENTKIAPLSLEEMTAQVIHGLNERIEAQRKQNEFQKVLIIASNEASIKAGDILVEEFCKSTDIVDIGRNKMYVWMRGQGYLFRNSRQPIQRYVDRGLLRWLPTDEKHGGEIQYTLFITARGKVWLAAKYLAYLDRDIAA